MAERVRSTVFRKAAPLSKEDQERRVAAVFATEYQRRHGVILGSGLPVEHEPPDWLFSGRGLALGCEMFEIEQLYASRAFISGLTDAIYAEFERRKVSERYSATVISAGWLLDVDTRERIERDWKSKGLRRPARQAAREFVDLMVESVSSRNDVPEEPGLVLRVQPQRYPALSALSKVLIVSRGRDQDSRRSDGRASPLVILSSGYDISSRQVQDKIEGVLRQKMLGRRRWSVSVDRAILIAHDLPREQMYEGGLFADWLEPLRRAVFTTRALESFDEVWLMTWQTLQSQAYLVSSRTV